MTIRLVIPVSPGLCDGHCLVCGGGVVDFLADGFDEGVVAGTDLVE